MSIDIMVTLSAVSPSAAKHKSDIYNIVLVFRFYVSAFLAFVAQNLLRDNWGSIYLICLLWVCAIYGAFFHRKMPILRQI